jgi:tripartite-type tricarboxylate transporter receptor subunit TctC
VHGTTHFAVQYLAEMKDLLEAGSLKALAVSGRARVSRLPAVPCGSEIGIDAFDLMGWSGVAGPEHLPPSIVEKWDAGIRELTNSTTFRARMESLGGSAAYLGPAEFKAALAAEYATALKFAEKLGLRR